MEKLLIPQLRFSEFEGRWKSVKIVDLTTVTAGGTPSTLKKEYWDGNIPWMNSGELNLKRIYEVQNRITELGLKKSSTKIIPVNSILIGLAGQGKTRGTAAINLIELCINQSIAAIYPNANLFCSEFLYQNIDNRYEELRNLSTGAGGRGGLNLSIIKSFQVSIPPLPEQQKIASFLTDVDTKITQLTKKKTLLEQYKKGVMQKIFNQELRFKDDNGNGFPEWEEKKLGELPIFISDGNYGELYPTSKDFKTKGIPFLRANNIKNLKIDDSDTRYITEEQHSILTSGHTKTNDVLITTRGELGNIALIESKHNNANINAQICLLRIKDITTLDYQYLLYVLDHDDSKKQYKAFETGTALKQLPKGNLRRLKIKLPSIKEQTKIANFLSDIDKKIETLNTQIEHSTTFKKGLLQQMFV